MSEENNSGANEAATGLNQTGLYIDQVVSNYEIIFSGLEIQIRGLRYLLFSQASRLSDMQRLRLLYYLERILTHLSALTGRLKDAEVD